MLTAVIVIIHIILIIIGGTYHVRMDDGWTFICRRGNGGLSGSVGLSVGSASPPSSLSVPPGSGETAPPRRHSDGRVFLVSCAAFHYRAPNCPNPVLLFRLNRFGRLAFVQRSVNPSGAADRSFHW